MRYQLVLQWPASSVNDYDGLIQMENALLEQLSGAHQVDGHDAGSGEMNIFVLTDDPVSAFAEVQAILRSRDSWGDARVAYRELDSDKYVILWPRQLSRFRVV